MSLRARWRLTPRIELIVEVAARWRSSLATIASKSGLLDQPAVAGCRRHRRKRRFDRLVPGGNTRARSDAPSRSRPARARGDRTALTICHKNGASTQLQPVCAAGSKSM
jgi:hypothetical protein